MNNSSTSIPTMTLDKLLSSGKISVNTYEKVKVTKRIIEKKYNMQKIKSLEWNVIMEKINSLDMSVEHKEQIKKEIYNYETLRLRKIRNKLTIYDYEPIEIIGRGAFGEVFVCRHKQTKEIVAIKKIKKTLITQSNQLKHIKDEQEFMSKVYSNWIVRLKCSFQEGDSLYLVMEYCPGGDLMNLLIERDILKEEEARFYIAEIILAVESLHKLDCIHRDLKPDNILLDAKGHIKLSDFGLAKLPDNFFEYSKQMNPKKASKRTYSCVGTTLYAAPELLQNSIYDKSIDWWSVGVMLYEMTIGYAPFCAKNNTEVIKKIMNFEKYFLFPSNTQLSSQALDLIKRMITDSDIRLGKNGVDEIKNHPFFENVNWSKIRERTPPFIPKLKSKYDTHYFDRFSEIDPFYPPIKKNKRKDGEYIGYTFKGEQNEQINLIKVLDLIEEIKARIIKENDDKAKATRDEVESISKSDNPHDANTNSNSSNNNQNQKTKWNLFNLNSNDNDYSNNMVMHSFPIKKNDRNKNENDDAKIHIITLPNSIKQINRSPVLHRKKLVINNVRKENEKSRNNNFMQSLSSLKKSISFKFKSVNSKSPE